MSKSANGNQRKVWLKRPDHLTYVVKPETILGWTWYYTEVLGGKLFFRVDDADPEGKSSMMIWGIDFGSFGIALVAGIDREEKSHVTAFAEWHGDHSLQHAAYDVGDLEGFFAHTEQFGMAHGEILTRHDGFGFLHQSFAGGYHGDANPSEVGFPEFLERPENPDKPFPNITLSPVAARDLYRQAQQAMIEDNRKTTVDFAHMPEGWEPPEPKAKK